MEVAEIVEFGRNFSTMVRVKGPDPKGLKMRNHAFHNYNSGITTLSASGMLLPHHLRISCMLGNREIPSDLMPGSAVVVSVASVIEPFLSVTSKHPNLQALPELIPHAQIDVLLEQKGSMKKSVEGINKQWFPAKILRLVDVPASSLAVKLLMEASSPSVENSWEVGWSLGSQLNHPKEEVNAMQTQEHPSFKFPVLAMIHFHLIRVRDKRIPSSLGHAMLAASPAPSSLGQLPASELPTLPCIAHAAATLCLLEEVAFGP